MTDTFIHLCCFEFTYLFNPGDQLIQKPCTWARRSAAREPAGLQPCAAGCTQRPASSQQQELVNCPRPFKQHFTPPDDSKGKHRFALPNKHQEKNVLSVYKTACQLNSSYIINNLSSPTIYLPHDVPAFFHSTQVVCMLSMPYALFLYCTLKTKPLGRRNTVHACRHTRQAFQPTPWQGGKSSSQTCLFNSLSLPSWSFSDPCSPPLFFPAYPHKG